MLKFSYRHLLICLLIIGLSGCGLQGGLETPQSSQKSASASTDSGQAKDEKENTKPERKFFLDRLLR